MAISTSNILPLLAFTTAYLVLLHGAKSQSVSFNFPQFNQTNESELILQGDATIVPSTGVLQLTRVDGNGNPLSASVGRVLYNTPVVLRSSTGQLSAFSTSFVVRVTSPTSNAADGFAFFLASPGSTIPPGSKGALLGLFGNYNALNNSRNEVVDFKLTASDSVVAVEFDTFVNQDIGDPNFRHVGVDVNSIRSRITREWGWVNSDPVAVTISYEPFSKVLSIVAAQFSGPRVEFSYEIDLTTVLPDTVSVGLSGSTGQYSQTNTLESWSFFQSLQRSYDVTEEGYIASVV